MSWLYRLMLIAVMLVAARGGHGPRSARATFTAEATGSANQFTAASLVLRAGVASGASLSVSNLVPGDSFTTRLTVENGGTLGLRYALSTSTTGDATLASSLQLTIRARTANPCSSLDGSVLYGPGNLNATAIGSPAYGADSGDRTLAAGSSEDLCFSVELPSTSGTSLQGKSVTPTFTFAGEQQ